MNHDPASPIYVVRCREKCGNERRWMFYSNRLGTTYLRIHASPFSEADAVRAVAELAEINPEMEFQAVQFLPKRTT